MTLNHRASMLQRSPLKCTDIFSFCATKALAFRCGCVIQCCYHTMEIFTKDSVITTCKMQGDTLIPFILGRTV
jgi:hypothetical protein